MAWPAVSTGDVAEHVPHRVPPGGWTATSVPSVTQVDGMISDIESEVEAFVLYTVPVVDLEPLASFTISIGAASEVERALFPEQAAQPGSTYEQLRERYLELKRQLYEAIHGAPPPSVEEAVAFPPQGTFPEPAGMEEAGY